jgi:hypothetical protein
MQIEPVRNGVAICILNMQIDADRILLIFLKYISY